MQLLIFNEEFLVSACHQRALITSLPFVHTARRSYRLNDPVRPPDCGNAAGSPAAMPREAVQTLSFRGRRSRNKVSVGEPAEGSLPVFPPALCVLLSSPPGLLVLCVASSCRNPVRGEPVGRAAAQALPRQPPPSVLSRSLVWSRACAPPPGACRRACLGSPSPAPARVEPTHNSCRWISWLSQR